MAKEKITPRYYASQIVEYFTKHPQGHLFLSTADKNNWLFNTDNTIIVNRKQYAVDFREVRNGIWEALLKLNVFVK